MKNMPTGERHFNSYFTAGVDTLFLTSFNPLHIRRLKRVDQLLILLEKFRSPTGELHYWTGGSQPWVTEVKV